MPVRQYQRNRKLANLHLLGERGEKCSIISENLEETRAIAVGLNKGNELRLVRFLRRGWGLGFVTGH